MIDFDLFLDREQIYGEYVAEMGRFDDTTPRRWLFEQMSFRDEVARCHEYGYTPEEYSELLSPYTPLNRKHKLANRANHRWLKLSGDRISRRDWPRTEEVKT
jgi:hypothetical protein